MIYAMNSHDAQLLTILGCWDKWLARQGIISTLCSAVWCRSYSCAKFFNNKQLILAVPTVDLQEI